MIEEGQSAEIDNQLGECYYVRGMMYFYLCRAYGRPYYQAPDKNLGVPMSMVLPMILWETCCCLTVLQ